MEVIATKTGYHGKLRAPGDRFDVPAGSKASWFVPVEQATSKRGKADKAGATPDDAAGDLV